MAYLDKNGIQFTHYDGNILPRSKKIGNIDLQDYNIDDFVDGSDIPTVVNAVEIDWNGAQLVGATIDTTGDLLNYIQNLGSSEGIQGPQGITGAVGPKGDDGAQGLKGITGVKGQEGNGIEFIFAVTSTPTAPLLNTLAEAGIDNFNDYWEQFDRSGCIENLNGDDDPIINEWRQTKDSENYDPDGDGHYERVDPGYIPPSKRTIINGEENVSTIWNSNPQSISQEYPYGWISKRTYENGEWSLFSEPALYAHYDENGASTDTDWNYSFSDGTTVNSKEDLLDYVNMLAGLVAALYAQLQLVDNN